MGAFPEERPSASPDKRKEILVCPEDVDWIFDVDTLRSAGRDELVRMHGLEDPPRIARTIHSA